ncbi:39S ribosomal protein L35, mitochondrial isoform X2 [Myxocyprinus asiaticus]|uniref:39S ribosomal protein L35, mitochondrial isoform X2 n=1 Tax=Myxocyprinus asiaticus TaxID=70543 RepID=UPI0022219183|nr:39S ribosomal protein L35, mitochondrial isoform X2 [Myxocyprinus asiaticus]
MAATLTRGLSGLICLLRSLSVLGRECVTPVVRASLQTPRFSTLVQRRVLRALPPVHSTGPSQQTVLLNRVTPLIPSLKLQPSRNLTYYSLRKGKRKSVKSVVQRFLRLHCGLWVRRKAGYKKKLWKKSAVRKKRLREHVFCNKTQCKLLDKMTTSFWKRRNWYLNDPYQKYHDRVNLKV